jgi:hypothetical protein
MSIRILAAAIVAGAAFGGGAVAATVTIDLGPSAQNYVLYGQGAYSPGLGSFTNQQGDESYDAGTNTTTDTLTGTITYSNVAALASGTYAFVTTYTGMPIGSGGTELTSISNPFNSNYFNYDYVDASVDITAYLYTAASGTFTIPLVTAGIFDPPSFDFSLPVIDCTGVAICTQNNVGLTPGATEYGPTDIYISYTTVPEPAAWSLMLLGAGALGGALRARRSSVPAAA